MRADKVEREIYGYIEKLFADPVDLVRRLKLAQEIEWKKQERKRLELKTVEGFFKQVETEIDEIATALRKARGRVGENLQAQQDAANARHAEYPERRENY